MRCLNVSPDWIMRMKNKAERIFTIFQFWTRKQFPKCPWWYLVAGKVNEDEDEDEDDKWQWWSYHIWRLWSQKQVSRAGISNYIPQFTVGCNYICLVFLSPKSSYLLGKYVPSSAKYTMMKSWHRSTFLITGPLWGESFHLPPVDSLQKVSV